MTYRKKELSPNFVGLVCFYLYRKELKGDYEDINLKFAEAVAGYG